MLGRLKKVWKISFRGCVTMEIPEQNREFCQEKQSPMKNRVDTKRNPALTTANPRRFKRLNGQKSNKTNTVASQRGGSKHNSREVNFSDDI